MKHSSILVLFVLMNFLFLTSCRKNIRDDQNDVTAAINNATAQNIFDGVWRQLFELVDSSTVVRAGNPTVTYSSLNPSVWPKTVTINYDSTGACSDSHIRTGEIIAVCSKKITDSLSTIAVSFNNYTHNSDSVSGTILITNKGRISGNYYYSLSIQNAIITNKGGSIVWAATQTKKWETGIDTPNDITDDVFSTTGSASGIALNGSNFESKITSALQSTITCGYSISGVYSVLPVNYSKQVMNYGAGVCDNLATVTINTIEKDVNLR